MKIVLIFIVFVGLVGRISAQTATPAPAQPGYANCDQCNYCPPNPPPQSWPACQKCLYPGIPSDPTLKASLLIDPSTNLPPTPVPGHQYTFLGCIGGNSGGFTQGNAVGDVIQALLNVVFSLAGGIAFLYLLYGAFILTTSQANPEKLNYGKRVIYGAIVGLIFSLGAVFIVKFIASGVLRIPGFGN